MLVVAGTALVAGTAAASHADRQVDVSVNDTVTAGESITVEVNWTNVHLRAPVDKTAPKTTAMVSAPDIEQRVVKEISHGEKVTFELATTENDVGQTAVRVGVERADFRGSYSVEITEPADQEPEPEYPPWMPNWLIKLLVWWGYF